MMGIPAGKLNMMVTFLAQTGATADARGGKPRATGWTAGVSASAEKLTGRALEKYANHALFSEVEQAYRVRYRPGITAALRVRAEGRDWEITGVLTEGRNEFLVIGCKAVTG